MIENQFVLRPENCLLMVVDIQDAFVPSIPDIENIIKRSEIMIQAAKLLDIPIIVTEQYPKGLGRTVESLQAVLGDITYYDKTSFSCLHDETILKAVNDLHRSQLLMVGIETHVCISQTSFDAMGMDITPYLAADALGSRNVNDHIIALQRIRQDGGIVTTTEAAIMEMVVHSKHEKFRDISKLIK